MTRKQASIRRPYALRSWASTTSWMTGLGSPLVAEARVALDQALELLLEDPIEGGRRALRPAVRVARLARLITGRSQVRVLGVEVQQGNSAARQVSRQPHPLPRRDQNGAIEGS